MTISYHVYANDGQGGPVDYDNPIATTATTTFVVGTLAAPSDNTFAVRAFDEASGVEEANTDARVRVFVGSDGSDQTARPNGVLGLSARPTAGGTCWVSWSYDPTGQGMAPSAFLVFLGAGATGSLGSPAASVDYSPGSSGHGCTLSGLAGTGACAVTVRAIAGPVAGPASTTWMNNVASPLSPVEALVAVATP